MKSISSALATAALLSIAGGCLTVGEVGNPGSGPSGEDPGNPDPGDHGAAPAGLVFSAYKDTSINMNWNTNVVTTKVPGEPTALVDDLVANGAKAITLAFATGECGSESWGGVQGAAMASANAPLFAKAGVKYILSTGGAAGTFNCGSDAGFATFLDRWAGDGLIGVDFDIETGQSKDQVAALLLRAKAAHAAHPSLRFSLTLATLANNDGQPAAHSIGAGAPDGFNATGALTMQAVEDTLGFDGTAATWPSYLTVALMTMDYGAAGPGVCVVKSGECDMGQSAIQAAYNLHDHWGVPMSGIELTPMIGGNDAVTEHFTLADVDAMTSFAIAQKLAGVHYWSYDRDVDCPAGSASPTCNTLGGVGAHGFLARFLSDGMR